MIIGVAAVIAMVALGKGAQSSIETQIKSAGTNIINVMAGNFMAGGVRMGGGAANTLTVEDADAIRNEVPGRPVPGDRRQHPGAGHRGQPELADAHQRQRGRLAGHPVLGGQVRGVLHPAGRQQRRQGRGARARRWRPTSSARTPIPTGQIIRIKNQPFKVIGVMASKGPARAATTRTTASSSPTRPARRS